MEILYVCDFDLSRNNGKDRATKQKLKALKTNVDFLTVISAVSRKKWMKPVNILYAEFLTLLLIVKNKPDFIISRGYVGILFQVVAKWFDVVTVREVHADAGGELELLPYDGIILKIVTLFSKLSMLVDKNADIRIFNHPDLMVWFGDSIRKSEHDFYVYNGYDPKAESCLTYAQALLKFNLTKGLKYLVFVGGASKWHGVDYLVALQEEFNKNGDAVQIVCGGGNLSAYDKNSICLNFTPLDDKGCADLIKAASLCLLPVKNNRVSPGSPLKLYDYIANKRFTVGMIGVNGYSDEIDSLEVGLNVEFADSKLAREKIIKQLNEIDNPDDMVFPNTPVSWNDRMFLWVAGLERYKSKCS